MPYWIDTGTAARLAIALRPRGGDWLHFDAEALKREGVDVLVSLLTPAESRELDLLDEAAACSAASIDFRNFPIPDRHTPESRREFRLFLEELRKQAHAGRSIATHCRAGIGRSSLTLAALMRLDGMEAAEAFARISTARGLQVPDTPEQIAWVERLHD
jgi:protein-tyrosine phosphatase